MGYKLYVYDIINLVVKNYLKIKIFETLSFIFRDSLTATEKKRFIHNPKHRRWKEAGDGSVPVVRW